MDALAYLLTAAIFSVFYFINSYSYYGYGYFALENRISMTPFNLPGRSV